MIKLENLPVEEKSSTRKTLRKDPDDTIRQKKEIQEINHKSMVSLLKLVPILSKLALAILILLPIVILPATEMSYEFSSPWYFSQDWTRAFVYANSTLGVAVITISIPAVLKFLHEIAKKQAQSDE